MIDTNILLGHFAAAADPAKCDPDGGNFLSFPHWYKYLHGVQEVGGNCAVSISGLNDIWLILLAIIEMLLRIAVLVAIVYVMIGGFKYTTSRASPDKTAQAKNTVLDGVFGLLIAIAATAVVAFLAGRFSQ